MKKTTYHLHHIVKDEPPVIRQFNEGAPTNSFDSFEAAESYRHKLPYGNYLVTTAVIENATSVEELEFPILPDRLDLLARSAGITNDQLMTVLCNLDKTTSELQADMADICGDAFGHDGSTVEAGHPDAYSLPIPTEADRYSMIIATVRLAHSLLAGPEPEYREEGTFEANDVVLTDCGHEGTVILTPKHESGYYSILTDNGQWVLERAAKMTRLGFKLFVGVVK